MTPDRVIGRNGGPALESSRRPRVFQTHDLRPPDRDGPENLRIHRPPAAEAAEHRAHPRRELVGGRRGGYSSTGRARTSLPGIHGRVFVIGGSEIYAAFLPKLEDLLVSHVFENHPGDTWFPEFEHLFSTFGSHRNPSGVRGEAALPLNRARPRNTVSARRFHRRVSACK